jgi:L-2-hydroxyglutarate oxidase LhgO
MDQVDILIIGAGVVGLSVAERLADDRREILLVERHDGFGRETSSRNSEVIHAGLYHPEDSFKASFCVKGNRMLYQLCKEKGIPFKKTGKIIVAQNQEEVDKIHSILKQGNKNGVEGLKIITKKEVQKIEPELHCEAGLFSPDSGILDTHSLMHYLEKKAESKGAMVAYNCEVMGVEKNREAYFVNINDADGQQLKVEAPVVINSAGLDCDTIASSTGIDIDKAGYRIHPCKGEYFSLASKYRAKLHHLIYPAPTPISLGVHVVVGLDGLLKVGPNAFYVDKIDYNVDLQHKQDFYEKAKRFLPLLLPEELTPDMAGIRPKLQRKNELFHDFIINEESEKGFKGLINLVGIESPGLTACLAIAEYVEGLL